MTITELTLDEWLRFMFDRPVTDPAWYWDLHADLWEGSPAVALDYLTRTFENAATLLAPFSDAQINQAFWYLIGDAGGEIRAVLDTRLPLDARVRCIRAMYPLFADCFLPRCPVWVPGGDPTVTPLALVVYMWWDLFPSWGRTLLARENIRQNLSPEWLALLPGLPEVPAETVVVEDKAIDGAVLDVMRRILLLPSDACRESALHGLGHWEPAYPDPVHAIIDAFLADGPTLPPQLRAYADSARRGRVQ